MGDERVAYVGIKLKLACPAPVNGRIVSTLIRVGDEINYQVEGSGVPELPWPPDPASANYGERCSCETCEGRLVGAPVEELRDVISDIHGDYAVNQDTYFYDIWNQRATLLCGKCRCSATRFNATPYLHRQICKDDATCGGAL